MKIENLVEKWKNLREVTEKTIFTLGNTSNIVYLSQTVSSENKLIFSDSGCDWSIINNYTPVEISVVLTYKGTTFSKVCDNFEINLERMAFNKEPKPVTFIHIKLADIDKLYKNDPETFDQLAEDYNWNETMCENGKQKYTW